MAMTSTTVAPIGGGPPHDPDIVVTVGTDHHPFDRLIGWVEEWCENNPHVDVVVQRGSSRAPANCRSCDLIPHDELLHLFTRSKLVVGHGGPSTVMDARLAGRLPVVVARDPVLGEHVDDHQIRFGRHLVRHGMARVVSAKTELWNAIDRALVEPEQFEVEVASGASEGVLRFGRLVDDLLRTSASPRGGPSSGLVRRARRSA